LSAKRIFTAAHRRNISKARKGRPLSAEHRVKFLEGKRRYYEEFYRIHGHHPRKGKHPSTEFKKGNKFWVGRHHTDISKKKLSEVFKGKKLSAEVRTAISKGHMGQVPWNKGLTKETTPSVAIIGAKTKARWTEEKRRELAERNRWFFKE
jgi:hypothetical protein